MGSNTWFLVLAALLGAACGEPQRVSPADLAPEPQNPGAFVCVPGTEPHIRAQSPEPGNVGVTNEFILAGVDRPWRYSTAPDVKESTVGRLEVVLWSGAGNLLPPADLPLATPTGFDLSKETPDRSKCGVCVNLIIGTGETRRVFSPFRGTLLVKQLDPIFAADLKGVAFREVGADNKFLPDGCRPVLPEAVFSLPVEFF